MGGYIRRANEKIQAEKNGTDKGKMRRYRLERLETIEENSEATGDEDLDR